MSDKTNNIATMVLIVDKNNNINYKHYKGDLNKDTYYIRRENYGKHLFKTLQLRDTDLDKHKENLPLGTDCYTYYGNCYVTNIDYYIESKSVIGQILERKDAEINSLQEQAKRLDERGDKLYRDLDRKDNYIESLEVKLRDCEQKLSYTQRILNKVEKDYENLGNQSFKSVELKVKTAKDPIDKIKVFKYISSLIIIFLIASIIFFKTQG